MLTRRGMHRALTTVAEGIEYDDQRDRLRELQCPFGQDYLFLEAARPGRACLTSQPAASARLPAGAVSRDEGTGVPLRPAADASA